MSIDSALKYYSEKYQLLHVPGIGDSGETHWHTNWEKSFPKIKRINQKNWDLPNKGEWVDSLEASIQKCNKKPIILISHSLGGGAIIHANELNKLSGVKGILMVALPDIEREDFPKECSGFVPMPKTKLSIPAVMISSENDEWCDIEVAKKWAATLQIPIINIGKKKHICGEEEFKTWEEGKKMLVDFLNSLED